MFSITFFMLSCNERVIDEDRTIKIRRTEIKEIKNDSKERKEDGIYKTKGNILSLRKKEVKEDAVREI